MSNTNKVGSMNPGYIASDEIKVFRKIAPKKQSTAHITPEFLKMLAKVQGRRPMVIRKAA